MGLKNTRNGFINEDKYVFPDPEIIIQTTRNINNINMLATGEANNDNGYIYFYADADWKKNPTVYIGESKNSLQSRHNGTHKGTPWFASIKYPFIGIVNSPFQPWDTDTRRAIESITIHKVHSLGLKVVNNANSTWTNGGTIHPNVNPIYVEAVADIIVNYIVFNLGYISDKNKELNSKTKQVDSNVVEKKYTVHNVSVKDLIEAGLIAANTVIYSTERLYAGEAIILADGNIKYDGEIFTSLSEAGWMRNRKVKPEINRPNGWSSWATIEADGSYKKMFDWRKEYEDKYSE